MNPNEARYFQLTNDQERDAQHAAVADLSIKQRGVFGYMSMLHRSLGYPSDRDAIIVPTIQRLKNRGVSDELIEETADLILRHSIAKIGYQRKAQSLIGGIIPTGLRSTATLDALRRNFCSATQYKPGVYRIDPSRFRSTVHVHMTAAFTRSSTGVTKLRGSV